MGTICDGPFTMDDHRHNPKRLRDHEPWTLVSFDDTEFQQGFTAASLLRIAAFHGEEVAQSLDPEVVPIHVEHNPVPILVIS